MPGGGGCSPHPFGEGSFFPPPVSHPLHHVCGVAIRHTEVPQEPPQPRAHGAGGRAGIRQTETKLPFLTPGGGQDPLPALPGSLRPKPLRPRRGEGSRHALPEGRDVVRRRAAKRSRICAAHRGGTSLEEPRFWHLLPKGEMCPKGHSSSLQPGLVAWCHTGGDVGTAVPCRSHLGKARGVSTSPRQ